MKIKNFISSGASEGPDPFALLGPDPFALLGPDLRIFQSTTAKSENFDSWENIFQAKKA
jgi:hypothetical protein